MLTDGLGLAGFEFDFRVQFDTDAAEQSSSGCFLLGEAEQINWLGFVDAGKLEALIADLQGLKEEKEETMTGKCLCDSKNNLRLYISPSGTECNRDTSQIGQVSLSVTNFAQNVVSELEREEFKFTFGTGVQCKVHCKTSLCACVRAWCYN